MNINQPLFHGFISAKRVRITIYQLCLSLLFIAVLSSCSKKESDSIPADTPATDDSANSATSRIDSSGITSGIAEGSQLTGANPEDLVENSTFSNLVTISFGAQTSISNPLAAAGISIVQSGTTISISSTADHVEFQLSGQSANTALKISSDKKFKLSLNGLNISNPTGPAIALQSKEKAFIVLKENTENTLTDGSVYQNSNLNAALYSEGQMIFSGTGALSIKGNNKHAIYSDDYIRIRSGNITIAAALKDGIHSRKAFIADGGTLNITAGSDGIDCENGFVIINSGSLQLNTVENGIAVADEGTDKAVAAYVNINGGSITLKSSAGEGIKSKGTLTINKGNLSLNTVGDALSAASSITINGGNTFAFSFANDGLDSDGTLTITGGKVVAIGSRSPEAGIDCDARTFKITGGMVLGLGGTSSSPSPAVSTIRSVIAGSGMAKSIIHIESADGLEALTFAVPVTYSTMLFSSAKLKANSAYNFYNGGSVAAGSTFNGVYTSGIYTKGIKYATFTSSSMVTQIGGTINKG